MVEIKEPETETSEGNPQDKLAEARILAERIEKANEETRRLLEEREKLLANEIVSGHTVAGASPKQEPQEETPKEYAQKVLRGEI